MQKDYPLVTILIAHYNYLKYLPSAIESSIQQDYPNFRICIVDDGSDDERCFWDLINDYLYESEVGNYKVEEEKTTFYYDKHIVIRCNNNGGPSKARNIGIEETITDTDYYLILDADDFILPNKITELIKPMLEFPDTVAVCYGDYYIENELGITRQEYKTPYSLDKLSKECIVHSGSLINKNCLVATKTKYGYYDERFRVCEDYQLWLRLCKNYMIFHIPKFLTVVRDHNQNSSNTVDKSVWIEHWSKITTSLQEEIV